jgi:hypothetical protein
MHRAQHPHRAAPWWRRPSLAALHRLARHCGGNVAISFALATPMVLGATAFAVDYSWMTGQRAKMQSAADAAALSTARELRLARNPGTDYAAVAKAYAQTELAKAAVAPHATINASINSANNSVEVSITAAVAPILSGILSPGSKQLAVDAVARDVGGLPICLVALDEKGSGTIHLEANARLTAVNCAVYSNSKNPQGMKATHVAQLTAALICSAGGKVGGKINFTPDPLTDCPVMPDPLAARPAPAVGGCTTMNKIVSGQTVTLNPGTYCNGLIVTGGAHVTLAPGTYIIKDGPLVVSGGSSFQGTNVGFYLTGDATTLLLATDTTINLTAPKDGPLSGILLFEDRAAPAKRSHRILSDNARTLLGTIYVPQGRLIIDATQPIADKSAYTIIVTRRMELYAGPNLVMNTDYGSTDIPVPRGVGIVGDSVALTK